MHASSVISLAESQLGVPDFIVDKKEYDVYKGEYDIPTYSQVIPQFLVIFINAHFRLMKTFSKTIHFKIKNSLI